MNKDNIIRMAREAGAIPIHKDYKQNALVGNENIERFARLVAAAEREDCWRTAENYDTGNEAAAAIRARGQQ